MADGIRQNSQMRSKVWQEIRALRAEPTHAAAGDPDRGRDFASALRQAEELAAAAAVDSVTYAVKPLPLFYSLSQAGHAIIAARHPAWPPSYRGHGLSVSEAGTSILHANVRRASRDAGRFGAVLRAIGSTPVGSQWSAELGQLWSANIDLEQVPIPAHAGSWPRPVPVGIGPKPYPPGVPTGSMMTTESEQEINGILAVSVTLPAATLNGNTAADVTNVLQPYPKWRRSLSRTHV